MGVAINIIIYYVLAFLLVCGVGLVYCTLVFFMMNKKIAVATPAAVDDEPIYNTNEENLITEEVPEPISESDVTVAPPTYEEPRSSNVVDPHSALDVLNNLRARGFISEQEFEVKKKDILG